MSHNDPIASPPRPERTVLHARVPTAVAGRGAGAAAAPTSGPHDRAASSRRALAGAVLALLSASSCSRADGQSRGPSYEPEVAATSAMATFDGDSNGSLSASEMEAAPGIAACMPSIDANGDGQVDRDELRTRLEGYLAHEIPYTDFTCEVFFRGAPLSGGKVRVVPEPFLADGLPIVEGGIDANGLCMIQGDAQAIPGVYSGMYRIEITSERVAVPEAYNTKTELGVELSPDVAAQRRTGNFLIDIRP